MNVIGCGIRLHLSIAAASMRRIAVVLACVTCTGGSLTEFQHSHSHSIWKAGDTNSLRVFAELLLTSTALTGWQTTSSFAGNEHVRGRGVKSVKLSLARARSSSPQLASSIVSSAPSISPTGVPNSQWKWRGCDVRYQALGEDNSGPSVVLVHGLFVNADHWRRNLPALAAAGMRVYAIDLLGYGYSSKPPPCSDAARAISGEKGRDLGAPLATLGTAGGGQRVDVPVEEAHPLGSVYNFYTWSEQILDFVEEVVKPPNGQVTLVANSIGSISALQAAIDAPDRVSGVAIVNPNFRELHVSEQPSFLRPVVSAVQAALRKYGQPLFDSLAKPSTVKQILKEPYFDAEQVTDELVDVLLTPLLIEGSADVVFDTLSYSAGPLPEQQLANPQLKAPVLVCWGEKDPWTPSKRVLGLSRFDSVERVVPLPDVGHCPHDEAPELVNPLLIDFVQRVTAQK